LGLELGVLACLPRSFAECIAIQVINLGHNNAEGVFVILSIKLHAELLVLAHQADSSLFVDGTDGRDHNGGDGEVLVVSLGYSGPVLDLPTELVM
jgi:hypothetical protein